MIKLKLTEVQLKFLENNFKNFSEEQLSSKVQFSMYGRIPTGKPKELKYFCTMGGIEQQLTKANNDNMFSCVIFYAHMHYPGKWTIEKIPISLG